MDKETQIDMKASLAEAFDEIQESGKELEQELADKRASRSQAKESDTAAKNADKDSDYSHLERSRKDDGKFAKTKKQEKADIKTSSKQKEKQEEPLTDNLDEDIEETLSDEGSADAEQPAEDDTQQPLTPPERWSPDWKAKFTTLPREAQQLLLDRESEYDQGFTQKSQEAAELKKRFDPIDQVLSQRRQQFALQGMNEQQGLNQLFALSDFAANRPEEFLAWFAKNRGINLAALNPQTGAAPQAGEGQQPNPAQGYVPEIAPILNEVKSLRQMIDYQQQAQADRDIQSFKTAPGHEHFNEVAQEMGRLMQHSLASDMQQAYDMACRMNPTVFAKVEAGKLAKSEAERRANEVKRIEDAKKAAAKAKKTQGTQITPKATISSGSPAPANSREALIEEYDRLHGAA